jgi:hypothetical protein
VHISKISQSIEFYPCYASFDIEFFQSYARLDLEI